MLKRKGFLPFIFAVSALILGWFFQQNQLYDSRAADLEFLDFLEKRKEILHHELSLLVDIDRSNELFSNTPFHQSTDLIESVSFFIERQGKLVYWSEEDSPIDLDLLHEKGVFVANSSAIFLKTDLIDGDDHFYAIEQIARRYPYENSYLKAEINKSWVPYLANIDVVQAWSSNEYFSEPDQRIAYSAVILILLSIALFIYSAPKLLNLRERSSWFIMILLILILRTVLYYLDPFSWSDLQLFSSIYFSYSWFAPTIGDTLINAFATFFLSYLIISFDFRSKGNVHLLFEFLFFLFLSFTSFQLIEAAVLNSQFSFELDNLFKLGLESYLLIISFGLFFLSSLLWIKKVFQSDIDKRSIFFLFLLLVIHFIILREEKFILFHSGLSVLILLLFWVKKSGSKLPDLVFILILLFSLSYTTAYIIKQITLQKENSARRVLLQKLAEERDPLLEYLFASAQNSIRTDDSLIKLLEKRWNATAEYDQYLRKKYFKGYWDRYRINLTLCSEQDSILIGGSNVSQGCFKYFQDRIYREGDQISSINLFQLTNLAGRIDYIGEIQIESESNYKLFLELSRDYFAEDLGYPELFLNEEDKQLRKKLDEYSYAVYYKGELINSEGDFVYTLHSTANDSVNFVFYSYETESFSHTKLLKNENISIVLSKRRSDLFAHISRVTYLLVIYGLLFLMFSLFLPLFPFYNAFILSDFSTKIRLLITGTLLLALVLFLSGTTYYIQEQYEAKNSRAIEEKLRSIGLELDSKIGDLDSLDESMSPYITSILIKFSNVFYTDINLYNSDGMLYASSRPELFDQKLKSKRMNPTAYSMVVKNDRSKMVQKESIGKLGYLSAYIPLKNRQNEILAYLNLPYFARQEELKEEISAFLAPTINSYVIIFTLALLISFLLINQISKPLLLIRNYISRLKLGSSTDLIDWQSNDEIGELVKEYNRIAIELGQSAEELAKREREGAWREMAKQIAHEIKNPLTPMKLSIQHLQRFSEEDGTDLQARIKKTSETLISQIDSLSAIAEAFSSFTKFPDKELKEFDLYQLIQELSHLYSNQATISIENSTMQEALIVRSDRDLVLRIFNNLIKNAIQANDKEGLPPIEIFTSIDEAKRLYWKVEVKDHGKGIKAEQEPYIFDPSFTTKSSGTGLGLAIVKRSMEQLGGEIIMHSEVGIGTSFILYFPKA